MFQQLVVPIDGSDASWRALPIATRMAAAVDGTVAVVSVVDRLTDIEPIREDLAAQVEAMHELAVIPSLHVLADDSAARAIAGFIDEHEGSMICMASHGHARSAAVLGSTTDELLRMTFGPIVVVGPNVDEQAGQLFGQYVVAVDGSRASERIVPIAEAFAVEFGGVPWVVEVIDPQVHADNSDVMESAYPARVAREMRKSSGRQVEFEVLHSSKPEQAIVDYADTSDATLIFATTHGRTGLARLRLGSVAAHVVHEARCPVVLHRPPHLVE